MVTRGRVAESDGCFGAFQACRYLQGVEKIESLVEQDNASNNFNFDSVLNWKLLLYVYLTKI